MWADGALSRAEAAEFIGISTTEVDGLRSRGELTEARHGTRVLLSKRSCREYLARHEVQRERLQATRLHPRGWPGGTG